MQHDKETVDPVRDCDKGMESERGGIDASQPPVRRGAIRAMVQDFSPTWFTWCMNSGAFANLLHQNPYRFPGIDILANIFFIIDLVLWLLFSVLFVSRLLWFRGEAYRELVGNIGELTFIPCWEIAFMTLTSGVALIVSTASWGGYSFAILAYVMWWFVQTWNLVVLVWAFTTMLVQQNGVRGRLPSSIIIPAVSVSTVGVTGAVVATYAEGLSPRLVVPVMIVSFQWLGVGILMGLMLTGFLFYDLLKKGLPPPGLTAGMFILVGPMGQSAAGLQILAAAATTYQRFGDYDAGTFINAKAAEALAPACILIALLLNGLGVIWLILCTVIMIERAFRRELKWSPIWNATIFPNSTLTSSMSGFAVAMDSPAYRVVTNILIIILFILYLVNLAFTISWIWQGKLLVVREDPRIKQAMEQSKKD